MGKGGSKVAATAESRPIFDVSELDKLPKDIRERLISEYERHKGEHEELKAEYDHLKVDSGKCLRRQLRAILFTR